MDQGPGTVVLVAAHKLPDDPVDGRQAAAGQHRGHGRGGKAHDLIVLNTSTARPRPRAAASVRVSVSILLSQII